MNSGQVREQRIRPIIATIRPRLPRCCDPLLKVCRVLTDTLLSLGSGGCRSAVGGVFACPVSPLPTQSWCRVS